MWDYLYDNETDEYDEIYEDHEDETDEYSEPDENDGDLEERIEKLRGNIGRGSCLYCSAENGMKYDGFICFICSECGMSVHEDVYYMWAAGCPIKFTK